MKRSEIVDLIYGLVSVYTDESCCNLGFNREAADEILTSLEVRGMLPPPYSFYEEHRGEVFANRWEDEES